MRYDHLNDRPSAIINCTMLDIWKTVPDSQTIRPTRKTKRTEVLYISSSTVNYVKVFAVTNI